MYRDLREWLDTSELIGLVLEAVHTLYWTSHEEKEAGVESNHPQLILGLLAYSYATGRYSANEITRQTTTDTAFNYLCLNNRFPRRRLCLFRNQNRELIRRCLSRVLRQAWEIRFGDSFSDSTANARLERAWSNFFNNEADERIGRALWTDYHTVEAKSGGGTLPTATPCRA